MLTELPPSAREALRPLVDGGTGLHGCIDAVLEGTMATARVDDPAHPRIALLDLNFCFIAGDPHAPAAEEAVRSLEPRASIVTSRSTWEPLLRRVWGDKLNEHERVDFDSPHEWDRSRLRGFIDALPNGFGLKSITGDDAARFAELADSLVYNFPSLDDFVARGAGFGIEHEGRFVSGCSSFAICSHSLEFEIQTHEHFRNRGLASATAAAMIEYCIDAGLEPCWDAHNKVSANLAIKLGFVDPKPYTSYWLRQEES